MYSPIVYLSVIFAAGIVAADSISSQLTVHKLLATWQQAKLQCYREGGVLTSPIDGDELNAMKALMKPNKTYHIGTRAGYTPGTYLSVEGVPLENMTEVMNSMIEELDPLDGDCLAMNRENIHLVPCWTRLQYMCKQIQGYCGPSDEGYKYYSKSKKCYKSHEMPDTWEMAKNHCTAEGAQLAVIENEDDMQNFKRIPELFEPWSKVFIGLQDTTGQGDWTSVDGRHVENLYNVWTDDVTPVEDMAACATINLSGILESFSCENIWYFVCEKKAMI